MITKLKPIAVIALLATAVLSYSSCQKDNSTTAKDNSLEIATQIATNFYKSIGNTIASQTSTAGLPTTSNVRNGKKVNDLTCGEVIEVPYNNVYTKGDSVKDVMIGKNQYTVTCSGAQPNGYHYTGKYVNTGFSPYSTYDNSVDETYTLKALLPEFAKMRVDGDQVSVYKFTTKKDGEYMEQHNSYVLAGLIIDASARPFDITAGKASFESSGTNAGKEFSFKGTITFLGNHKAKVAFNGKVFDIEIL